MSGTINNIQALRFFAAFAVVFAHVPLPRYAKDGIPTDLFSAGAFGVDVFFVISGFIMAYVSQNMTGGKERIATEFIVRRVLRVAPLYWLFTCVAWYLAYISVNCPPGLPVCPFWLSEHYNFAKTSFDWFSQSLTFTHFDKKPIYDIGWTLIYEFWFYALFALSLLAGWKATRYFTGLLALIVVTKIIADGAEHAGLLRVLLHPMMIEFVFGVYLFSIFKSTKPQMKWIAPAVVVGGILLALYQSGTVVRALDSFARPLLLGGAAFCIVAIALILERAKVQAGPRLIRMGDASYSLYLTHWLVVTTLPSLLTVFGIDGIFFAAYVSANVAVSIALSLAVFHLIESPSRAASKAITAIAFRPALKPLTASE